MTVKEAMILFSKKVKGRKVVGYWVKENGYVLNTKLVPSIDGISEPGQFMVTHDGKVYGTNPMTDDLDQRDYKKL